MSSSLSKQKLVSTKFIKILYCHIILVSFVFQSIANSQDNHFLSIERSQSNSRFDQPEYDYIYNYMLNDAHLFNSSSMPYTTSLLQNMIVVYQNVTSSKSAGCQFLPSCSRYAYMSLSNYGPIIGISKTMDRLWRCTQHAQEYYPIYDNYLLDPPSSIFLDDKKANIISDSMIDTEKFIRWAFKKNEYDIAYNEYTKKEFAMPSIQNRIMLSKLALNADKPDNVLEWLATDSITYAIWLRAIANYRMCKFEKSRSELINIGKRERLTDEMAALYCHALLNLKIGSNGQRIDSLILIDVNNDKILALWRESLSVKQVSSNELALSIASSTIIPGFGQAINGFWQDGLLAFLFNGFGACILVTNIRENHIIESAFWSGFFIFTYSTNIIAAYNAPLRKNEAKIRDIHEKLNVLYNPFFVLQFYFQ
jgi:putative component of membrane protein insertase Oxa1/YidC/SpoIIIJ protein YidD